MTTMFCNSMDFGGVVESATHKQFHYASFEDHDFLSENWLFYSKSDRKTKLLFNK